MADMRYCAHMTDHLEEQKTLATKGAGPNNMTDHNISSHC